MAIEPRQYTRPEAFTGDQAFTMYPIYYNEYLHDSIAGLEQELNRDYDSHRFRGPRVLPQRPSQERLRAQREEDVNNLLSRNHPYRNMGENTSNYLKEANKDHDSYIDKYLSNFRKRIVDPYRAESIEEFLEKTVPGIDRQYVGMSAYGGGREKAFQRSLRDLEKTRTRETDRLMMQGMDAAQRDTEAQKAHGLSSAHLASGLQGQYNQQRQNAMTALGAAEGEKYSHDSRNLEEQIKEHDRAQSHVEIQQNKKLNALRGMQLPTQTSAYALPRVPVEPNEFNQIGSLMGQMAGIPQKRGGGSVRAYAGGGNVMDSMPPDENMPAMQNAEIERMRAMGRGVDQYTPDPMKMAMWAAGNKMGERTSFGRAMGAAQDQYLKSSQTGAENQVRASNIAQAIQESRVDQHKFLSEHHNRIRVAQEQKRMNNSTINMNKAHANYYNSQSGIGSGQEDPNDLPTKKMTASREKAIQEADNTITALLEAIDVTEETGSALEKVGSGPIVGGIAEAPVLKQSGLGAHIASIIPGSGTPEDISNASAISNEYLKQLGDLGEKHGRNIPELRVSQQGKIGVEKYPTYNKWHKEKTVKKFREGLNRELRKLELAGAPPNMIAATKERIEGRFNTERSRIGETSDHGEPSGVQDKIAILKEAIAAQKAANTEKKAKGHG